MNIMAFLYTLHLATVVRKLYYPYLTNTKLLQAHTIVTKDIHGQCIGYIHD